MPVVYPGCGGTQTIQDLEGQSGTLAHPGGTSLEAAQACALRETGQLLESPTSPQRRPHVYEWSAESRLVEPDREATPDLRLAVEQRQVWRSRLMSLAAVYSPVSNVFVVKVDPERQ
jgi:hypothetical protein